MDSTNSTTFIKRPPNITLKDQCLLYTREILCGRLFLGCYQDRRYVSVLGQYRDMVTISTEEVDLHHDLDKVIKKWMNVTSVKWVGITGPKSVGAQKMYCFWVKLSNLPFDHYWFQIKHVKLVDEEILLHLKCIRKSIPPNPTVSRTLANKNEAPVTSTPTNSSYGSKRLKVYSKTLIPTFQEACNQVYHNIEPCLTWRNFFGMIRMTLAIIVAVVFGILSCIRFFAEYFLRVIRELSILIQAISPIVIELIDLFTKIIGGFFILLAGMFGRNKTHSVTGIPYRNINQSSIMYADDPKVPPLQKDWRVRNRILREELLSSHH